MISLRSVTPGKELIFTQKDRGQLLKKLSNWQDSFEEEPLKKGCRYSSLNFIEEKENLCREIEDIKNKEDLSPEQQKEHMLFVLYLFFLKIDAWRTYPQEIVGADLIMIRYMADQFRHLDENEISDKMDELAKKIRSRILPMTAPKNKNLIKQMEEDLGSLTGEVHEINKKYCSLVNSIERIENEINELEQRMGSRKNTNTPMPATPSKQTESLLMDQLAQTIENDIVPLADPKNKDLIEEKTPEKTLTEMKQDLCSLIAEINEIKKKYFSLFNRIEMLENKINNMKQRMGSMNNTNTPTLPAPSKPIKSLSRVPIPKTVTSLYQPQKLLPPTNTKQRMGAGKKTNTPTLVTPSKQTKFLPHNPKHEQKQTTPPYHLHHRTALYLSKTQKTPVQTKRPPTLTDEKASSTEIKNKR